MRTVKQLIKQAISSAYGIDENAGLTVFQRDPKIQQTQAMTELLALVFDEQSVPKVAVQKLEEVLCLIGLLGPGDQDKQAEEVAFCKQIQKLIIDPMNKPNTSSVAELINSQEQSVRTPIAGI